MIERILHAGYSKEKVIEVLKANTDIDHKDIEEFMAKR